MQETEEKEVVKQAQVSVLTDNLVTINGEKYHLVENHDDGFDREKIEERYNTVLEKYDFIVGDWGYDQLRFKGFYEDVRKESGIDNRISHLEDYLIEYCNFGCAYFILEKDKKAPEKKQRKNQSHKRNSQNHVKTGKIRSIHKNNTNSSANNTTHNKKRPVSHNKKATGSTKTRNFKIRKIGEKSK
ncbi:YutD family protein [Companilactobacillus allii]|uniref:Transcriptional regulator n=1 Tax=Companilactobacillus allii TaxID=1847728 RepID=A0A1P8PZI7_9LACO|nr:YutD family protein [Companilactobacillus allii]APX71033.1 hypothetical protein BTM29_00040 [Companilactobacillus allii]USQ68111.1 YutD family protein [Companilactobacillus allii]